MSQLSKVSDMRQLRSGGWVFTVRTVQLAKLNQTVGSLLSSKLINLLESEIANKQMDWLGKRAERRGRRPGHLSARGAAVRVCACGRCV